uniref:RRM domain-containing protein n=1 Tax=Leersia perrieri TaxID=77586 RepID=A0A0D9XCE8_9ORYZ
MEATRVVAAKAAPGLNPEAEEFVPWWRRRPTMTTELSADAPEFVYEGYWRAVVLAAVDEYYAEDFVVFGFAEDQPDRGGGGLNPNAPEFVVTRSAGNGISSSNRYRRAAKYFSRQGRAQFSSRVQRAQKEEFVRRTIFVTDIDHTITEDMLAELFGSYCSVVVDCRICGDPTSSLRFAFIEFHDENDAYAALDLDGYVLGICPLRVSPSKTAIMPVNPSFLPQSEAEKEMCSRTIYCTNIDKSVNRSDLKYFCEEYFGQVSRLRVLGDDHHPTRIAFIEFVEVNGAINALNSSGILASGQHIRVCPSKTPIRTFQSFSSANTMRNGRRSHHRSTD